MARDLACVRQRLVELESGVELPAFVDDFRSRARTLVVLASSSRGGSSVFAEMLRRTPRLLHFRAEVNPFFVLAGLTHPASAAGSDALYPGHVDRLESTRLLERSLALDCGNPSVTPPTPPELESLALELARRLTMQWPRERFGLAEVRDAMGEAIGDVRLENPLESAEPFDASRFHAAFLRRIRALHPPVDPWYYDLSPERIAFAHPGLPTPEGPPGPLIIEEPPFVTVQPWIPATPERLESTPVVMKTPSNVYRLAYLRRFFPCARLRVLHLVRNAAASINGLVDGWGYRGFFAHRVDRPLAIAGYSDRYAWGRHWWKFDLPPGWEAVTRRSLVEVCAFQWHSAHDATLRFLRANPDVDTLRLRFEDVVGNERQRRRAFERLTSWLDIDVDEPLESVLRQGAPPVMATLPPRQRRWFQKADLLEPVLSSPEIVTMMERLGYENNPDTWL